MPELTGHSILWTRLRLNVYKYQQLWSLTAQVRQRSLICIFLLCSFRTLHSELFTAILWLVTKPFFISPGMLTDSVSIWGVETLIHMQWLKIQLRPYIGIFLTKYKVLQNVQLIRYIDVCWWSSKSSYWTVKVFVNF